ncbi:MAG: ABC transporter permease subunit, partial [Pseudomonadota bacterium]
MQLASISAVDEGQISAARAAHPGAFRTPWDEVKKWAPWVIAIAYVIGSLIYFDIARLLEASERVLRLLRAMVVWEDMATWQYANIYTGIAQTLAMAFLGTLMGTIGSLFVGFLAAKNVNPSGFLRQIVRRFLDILRGIDQLVWGLVFVRAVGLGPLAGVLAIFISDLGTLSKLYSEAIENIDRKQVEGVRATGAGPLAVIRYGYL